MCDPGWESLVEAAGQAVPLVVGRDLRAAEGDGGPAVVGHLGPAGGTVRQVRGHGLVLVGVDGVEGEGGEERLDLSMRQGRFHESWPGATRPARREGDPIVPAPVGQGD